MADAKDGKGWTSRARVILAGVFEETVRLDVVFNNAWLAGGQEIQKLLHCRIDQILRVQLLGAFYGLPAALPVIRVQRYGRIINTPSRGAEAKRSGWSAYGAAKACEFAPTRVAAAEARADGILINGMILRPTLTGMNTAQIFHPPRPFILERAGSRRCQRTARRVRCSGTRSSIGSSRRQHLHSRGCRGEPRLRYRHSNGNLIVAQVHARRQLGRSR